MAFIPLTIVSDKLEVINYINVAHLISFRPLTHNEVVQKEKYDSYVPAAANAVIALVDDESANYVKENVFEIGQALSKAGIPDPVLP